MNVHCLSQASVDSEELGFEISFFLLALKHHMHTMFNMQRITSPSQSKANNIEKDGWNYHYDSIVSFSYAMAVRSTHTPVDLGPMLSAVVLELSTQPESNPVGGDDEEKDDGWVTQKIFITEDGS